jgi:hypothetical protein
MSKKVFVAAAIIAVSPLTHAGVLCSNEIQKKAEVIAEEQFGGTCVAGTPENQLAMAGLRGVSGTISGVCKRHVSAVSVIHVPFTYSFSVSAIAFNESKSCDNAYSVFEELTDSPF